jgi:hypothetical protein
MSDKMSDDQLLAQLAAALYAVDPAPEHVLNAARAAFTWRTIDAELAALVFDSAVEDLLGVRSAETPRQLTFSTPGFEVELIILSDTTRRIIGQLVPPQAAEIMLHHETGETVVRSDGLGRFAIDDVPVGSVRITCRLEGEDGPVVQTEWTTI